MARVIPFERKAHRTGRGSLRGRLLLPEDWDSREVSEAIAREFGAVE